MKIVSLDVQNIKRIRAVHIAPNGSSAVIIGGQNAQGKTSVLDAIQMALGGAKTMPADPIRHGASKASVVANLGDLVVERVITKTGTQLTVRDADGVKQRSPQAILDALCGRLSFDPLAFLHMEPRRQNETLRELLGLDFSDHDAKREALFAKRTETTREAKSARALAENIAVPAGTPSEPVVLSTLLEELRTAHQARDASERHARELDAARAGLAAAEEQLRRAEALVMQRKTALRQLERSDVPPAPDTSAIERAIANAENTNRAVQLRQRRDEAEKRANDLDAAAAELTARLEAMDQAKRDAIAAKPFPVDGLALGDDGPTFNGVPLEQASGAEKLRVSVALGLAMNPQLKVLLVRDASLLDAKSLELVTSMAAAAGAQVWLERVGGGDPTAVVIEDGQVANAAANDAA